jgi:hypothetical protein
MAVAVRLRLSRTSAKRLPRMSAETTNTKETEMFGQRDIVGKRVRLISCSDPYTKLRAGEEGTITFVDDLGTVDVKWDSGSRLGLIPYEDHWDYI